jgi:hypothetical protein
VRRTGPLTDLRFRIGGGEGAASKRNVTHEQEGLARGLLTPVTCRPPAGGGGLK